MGTKGPLQQKGHIAATWAPMAFVMCCILLSTERAPVGLTIEEVTGQRTIINRNSFF